MPLYDDLRAEEADLVTKFRAYEDECFAVSTEVLDEVRAQLGWPQTALVRLKDPAADDLPEGCRAALHGGWFDAEKRYCFLVRALLATTNTTWITRIWRDQGSWHVSFGEDQPVRIDRGNKASAGPLAENVVAAVRSMLGSFYPANRLAV